MSTISVIVPVYKVEPYLRRCVDSILNQTFTDFDLILVDDGSPDGCPAICDEYAKKDDRIVVIHQKNGGLSAARNAGIDWAFANSDSKWLSFVDSDDWVHSEFLSSLYRAVTEDNVDISICYYEPIENESDVTKDEYAYTTEKWDAVELYTDQKFRYLTVSAWNKLYSKKVFGDQRYPVGKIHEDFFVTYKLVYASSAVTVVTFPLYKYFIREQSIMHSKQSRASLVGLEALEEQCAFFASKSEKAYKITFKHRISSVAYFANLAKTDEEIAEYRKPLQKELRTLLKQGRSLCDLSWYYDYHAYRTAFPMIARVIYPFTLFYHKVKNMIKRVLKRLKPKIAREE